ncbi:type I restriction enzyme HsdR N-terminal domain-containing protein [Coprobacter tertius]|uniref:Type I restriction enzyme HsdR N-terminal domain-containing protein n=1 Tax=Coprobacter tertius TaxID=2944915 RepID=A0ABT1MHM0_9BACT|nr:type I restriction enzyme HsdR N-terminal domain-containing protein [Coprobacter tertius]MCP9612110.1 type I restriction enzyme HsdR N-terminal domain-containing protein [Coprobacter tertius]
MTGLNLPSFDFHIKKNNDKYLIFDNIRKKYITLTPEEWVRQHFVCFLTKYKSYPAGRLGNEISLVLNGRKRRCDTIVYDKNGKPLVIIEYKAPEIILTQEVFDQIIRYNIALKVKYLMVSNGLNHYCCKLDYETMQPVFLPDIPFYDEL